MKVNEKIICTTFVERHRKLRELKQTHPDIKVLKKQHYRTVGGGEYYLADVEYNS